MCMTILGSPSTGGGVGVLPRWPHRDLYQLCVMPESGKLSFGQLPESLIEDENGKWCDWFVPRC